METKPNQRISLTKELVRRALIRLLKTQPLHKISIRQLCEIAGINRTTFYNHYGSQYDVLAEIRDGYLKDVAAAIETADPRDRERVWDRVALVFAYMESNLEISRLLIQTNIDETFAQRLFSLPQIEELLIQSLKDASPAARQEMIAFAIYGSYKLIQDWLSQPSRRSPREMADLVLTLSSAVCACSLQG